MKFTFKPSPNYRDQLSTGRVMLELTVGLLVVFLVTLGFYATNPEYGMNHVVRAVLLMLTAVVTACLTEAIWCVCTKKDLKTSIKNSYPWVSAIILVLMCPINMDYYPLIIATIVAIFFGKLVFGGFGQNIFNPAAVGRAVIFSSFSGAVAADVVTGATPTTAIASNGWLVSNESAPILMEEFGGLTNMLVGNYSGAIGETSAIVILLVGIFLAWRKILDWRVPVTYIATVFVITLIIGLTHGVGVWYPMYHILTGGLVFGAVFMLTDPVTNPTSIPGRIIFAIGAAGLTVVIRLMSNLPEGVLYSILIMNMLTPMIEKALDNNQIKAANKNMLAVSIVFITVVAVGVLSGTTLEASEISGPTVEVNGNVYTVTSQGYQGDNIFAVEVENGAVIGVECTTFVDTPGIGDKATAEDYLSTFTGKVVGDDMDIVSGATVTSNSVINAVNAALDAAK